jgi:hypothetical protein
MAKSEVEIKIHGSQALKQLTGVERKAEAIAKAEVKAKAAVEKAAKKAADTQAREAQRAAKAAERASQHALKAQTKAAQDASRVAAREAEKQKREADRLADYWTKTQTRSEIERTRIAQREAAKRIRNEQVSAKTRERNEQSMLRKGGGLISGAVGAVAGVGYAAMGVTRGVAGIQDPAERLRRANEFQTNLVLSAADAGMSRKDTEGLSAKIQSVGLARGQDPLALMEGLSEAHESFNQMKLVLDNLDTFAMTAKAQKTPFVDFVRSMLSMQTAFQLTSAQMEEAMNIAVAGGKTGSLSFEAFAGPFAPAMGTFALNTGLRGIEGVRQFVAGAQTVGAGQFGAEGAETRFSQAVGFLNKAEIQKDLRGIGVDVRDDRGVIDVGRVIELLAKNDKFQTPEQQAAIFKDMQAREGIQTLLAQRNKYRSQFTPLSASGFVDKGVVDFASMEMVDAKIGADATREKTARLEETGVLALERQAIEMQNESIRHFKELNDTVASLNKVFNELEKKIGPQAALLAPAVGTGLLTGTLAGGLPMVGNLLKRGASSAVPGAVAAAAPAGAGLLASLGAGVGAVGAGTLAAAIVAAGTAGAGAGWLANEVTSWIRDDDKSISDLLGDWMSSDVDTQRAALLADGKGPGGKSELQVDISLHDNRTEVKTKAKGDSSIRVGSGPFMPMSGKL